MDIEFLKKLKECPVKSAKDPAQEPTKRLFSDYVIVFTDGSKKTLHGVALCSIHDKPAAHFLDQDLNTVFVVSYHAIKYIYEAGYA